LRIGDIGGLASESCQCRISGEALYEHGATPAEVAFLQSGQRVELNAMTSEDFVAFVERKLDEHGIETVVPERDQLDDAYCAFARTEAVREAVDKALEADGGLSPFHSRVRQWPP
jgi:hypothetical protein